MEDGLCDQEMLGSYEQCLLAYAATQLRKRIPIFYAELLVYL
jgi:hypothetical protein